MKSTWLRQHVWWWWAWRRGGNLSGDLARVVALAAHADVVLPPHRAAGPTTTLLRRWRCRRGVLQQVALHVAEKCLCVCLSLYVCLYVCVYPIRPSFRQRTNPS